MCKRPSKASWLPRRAWSSTEPRLETSRRRHRSDGTTWNIYTASHGTEATQLEIMFPDGITKHLRQEAKDSLKKGWRPL